MTTLKRAMAAGNQYSRCHASELTVKEVYIAVLASEIKRLRSKLDTVVQGRSDE